MIQRCDSSIKQPQVLCLAPTREIAEQTADLTLTPLGNYASLKIFKAIRKQERRKYLTDIVEIFLKLISIEFQIKD